MAQVSAPEGMSERGHGLRALGQICLTKTPKRRESLGAMRPPTGRQFSQHLAKGFYAERSVAHSGSVFFY